MRAYRELSGCKLLPMLEQRRSNSKAEVALLRSEAEELGFPSSTPGFA